MASQELGPELEDRERGITEDHAALAPRHTHVPTRGRGMQASSLGHPACG